MDQHFLERFLPERLSKADYDKLMDVDCESERHGSGPHAIFTSEQHITLEKFQAIKHGFAGVPKNEYLGLPDGICQDENPLRGDERGSVLITAYGLPIPVPFGFR